jgi:hypothetical protein
MFKAIGQQLFSLSQNWFNNAKSGTGVSKRGKETSISELAHRAGSLESNEALPSGSRKRSRASTTRNIWDVPSDEEGDQLRADHGK